MSQQNTDTRGLVPLSEAARTLFPGAPRPSTVWRWATRGLISADPADPRIKLEIVYCGKRPYTTALAVRSFLDAVTAARLARIEQMKGPNSRKCGEDDAELLANGLL